MNGRCFCYISKVPAKDNSSKLMLKEMSHLTEMGVGLMWMDHFQRKEEGFSWKYGSKGWKEGKQWVQARSRDRRAQEGDSWLEDYSLSPSDGWRIVPFLFWWLEDCPLFLLMAGGLPPFPSDRPLHILYFNVSHCVLSFTFLKTI